MIYKVLSVYDRVSQVYGVPNYVVSIGGANRAFGDEINRADPQNALYQHPDDFELYELGEFDDQTAEFKPCVIRLIAAGSDLKKGDR